MSKFIKRELVRGTRLPNVADSASAHERVLKFATGIYGRMDLPDAVFVRKCYGPLMQSVLSAFKALNRGVFVAGTRGIGKSVFALLLVLELLAQGRVVVYEHLLSVLLLIPDSGLPLSAVASFEKNDVIAPTAAGIYSLKDLEEVRMSLMDVEDVYHVQDMGDSLATSTAVKIGNAPWAVISSPNADKLKQLRNNGRMKQLVMPLWTLDELEDARASVFLGRPEGLFSGYSAEEVQKRFELYGGVPRWVLERPRSSEGNVLSSEDELNRALSSLPTDALETAFKARSYFDIPKLDITSILVHFVEQEGCVVAQFASKKIAELLVEEMLDRQSWGVQGFVRAVSDVPALGAFRGHALEYDAHRKLPQGNKATFRELNSHSNSLPTSSITLPRMPVVCFEDEFLSDLTKLNPGDYVRPKSKIFPTLDSFAVLPLSVFQPRKLGFCLAAFQCTVAKTHKMDGSILTRVETKARALVASHLVAPTAPAPSAPTGLARTRRSRRPRPPSPPPSTPALPIVVVWVTGLNGIRTEQTIKGASEAEYKTKYDALQVALYLGGDFAKLVEFCEGE